MKRAFTQYEAEQRHTPNSPSQATLTALNHTDDEMLVGSPSKRVKGPAEESVEVGSTNHAFPRNSLPSLSTNGFTKKLDLLPKEQVVRLLLDSLMTMGYEAAAKALQEESKITFESLHVRKFKQGILQGEWDTVEALIPELKLEYEEQMKLVRFFIGRQKFLELLEQQNIKEALSVLRNELAPLGVETESLYQLSCYFLFNSPDELRKAANWDGAKGNSRKELLQKLYSIIPSHIMPPSNRLAELLNQAIRYQESQCMYHNPQCSEINLFEDHICQQHQIPWECKQVLREHRSEVYHAAFSNNGAMLATCSQDGAVILWAVGQEITKYKQLVLEEKSVTFVAWKNDDTLLLAVSEHLVAVWNVVTGESKCKSMHHKGEITSACWTKDGRHFLSGSLDGTIVMSDLEGEKKKSWKTGLINDMVLAPDGNRLVYICQDHRISILNLLTDTLEASLQLTTGLTSLSISPDGNSVLVTTTSLATPFIGLHPTQDILIFDISKSSGIELVRKLTGLKQSKFVVRACFGGPHGEYVISGSEDSMVYIWHRSSGELIARLGGHTSVVNAVAWHPTQTKFVSVSDDKTVRVICGDLSRSAPTYRSFAAAAASDHSAMSADVEMSDTSGALPSSSDPPTQSH